MKPKNKLFFAVLIFVVAVIFALVYMNYQYIQLELIYYIGIYNYPLIFVLSMILEGIEQPIGAEWAGISGVLLGLNPLLVIPAVLLGTYISSFINFYIGRKYFSKKILEACTTGRYVNYCKKFHDYGNWALLLAALTPLPYVIFVWISGAFYMRLREFITYALIPKTIRIIFLISIANLASTWM